MSVQAIVSSAKKQQITNRKPLGEMEKVRNQRSPSPTLRRYKSSYTIASLPTYDQI